MKKNEKPNCRRIFTILFFYEGDFNVNLTRKITYLYVRNVTMSFVHLHNLNICGYKAILSFQFRGFLFTFISIFNSRKKRVQFISDLLPFVTGWVGSFCDAAESTAQQSQLHNLLINHCHVLRITDINVNIHSSKKDPLK